MNDSTIETIGHHIVSFSYQYYYKDETIQETKKIAISGWILSIRGIWYFLTAGHSIQSFEALKNSGALIYSCLFENSSNISTLMPQAVALDLEGLNFFHIYKKESGIDFGMILIPSPVRALLEKNGIIPLVEDHWNKINQIVFARDSFYLIGASQTLTNADERPLLFLHIEEIDPVETEEKPDGSFKGHLLTHASDRIKGLSGGAIFGFSKAFDQYWLVALLSGWDQKKAGVSGCYIEPFIRIIEERMDSIKAQGKQETTP
jgi:hypothetical protein